MRIACFTLALLLSCGLAAWAADKDAKSDEAGSQTAGDKKADDKKGGLVSGPQVGEELPAFQVEKLAGAGSDNIDVGGKLCYRCMLGTRPVVMVFTRDLQPSLAPLIQKLDKKVRDKSAKKLASFVVLMDDDQDKLKLAADAIVDQLKVQNVAVVKSLDSAGKGPKEYKLNDQAYTTVLVYRDDKVESNFAIPENGIDEKTIKAILDATDKMLKKKGSDTDSK